MNSIQHHIQLPNKSPVKKTSEIMIPSNTKKYDVQPGICYFDPNIAGSPPNTFMIHLKMRMDKYYNQASNE
jgi:hypothetical protein